MSEYPAQYPWGPHGPRVDSPSVLPNPTIPSPQPTFPSWDAGAAVPSHPTTGGSVGPIGSSTSAFAGRSFGVWMRNLALAGGVLGCLSGAAQGLLLRQTPEMIGVLVVRLGIAGAAAGASIPPALRVFGSMLRAAVWLVIAVVLLGIAMTALGGMDWLTRLR